MSGGNGGHEEPVVGYLERVEMENIRSIAKLTWEVVPGPGWNVLLGDNGAGKSTVLRAVAMALVQDGDWWGTVSTGVMLRAGEPQAHVRLVALGKSPASEHVASFEIYRAASGEFVTQPGKRIRGCFSAGFGPFRRFTGGDRDYEKEHSGIPRVARHMSLFSERYSLADCIDWLKLLRFKELEDPDSPSAALLASLREFVNQNGFLPNGAHLDRVTSDNVVFIDGNGVEVAADDLSDGYRSILSLTFELIRQLAAHYGAERVFDATSTAVIAPGIVLIDEVDAHLHPTWQHEIGLFLKRCFPQLQFLVTTHSPLICQAADSVFLLPTPGSEDEPRKLDQEELDRLRYGNLLDAYGTGVFGRGVTRSEESKKMLRRLVELNRKQADAGLTPDEQDEQRRLRVVMPSEAPSLGGAGGGP